jgi:hypothetical protein
MDSNKLKEYLLQIAESVKEETKLEDIYDQLALLADIDESEEQERKGEVVSHEEVINLSKGWLK